MLNPNAQAVLQSLSITPGDMDVLRGVRVLGVGCGTQADTLMARLTVVRVEHGRRIFPCSEADGRTFYIVLEGRIAILGRGYVRCRVVDVLGPGDTFGDMTLLDPGGPSWHAVALTSTRLAAIPVEDLMAWITGDPDRARGALRSFAGRVRLSHEHLTRRFLVDVPHRLAGALLDMAGRFGEPADEGTVVRHGLTQEQLAGLVGSSREAVNRSLARFVRRGWIGLGNRAIVLRDQRALERYVTAAGSALPRGRNASDAHVVGWNRAGD